MQQPIGDYEALFVAAYCAYHAAGWSDPEQAATNALAGFSIYPDGQDPDNPPEIDRCRSCDEPGKRYPSADALNGNTLCDKHKDWTPGK